MTSLKSLKNNLKTKYLPFVLLILAVIFWGCSFISTKIVLKEVPPISIAFFRQIIASTVLFAWVSATRSFARIGLRDLGLIALGGLFGIVLYFIFENTALLHTTASNASMISAAVPIFTLLTESLFYKMKISRRMLCCIISSIIGVYLVISINGKLDFSSRTFFGNMLEVCAMASWVIFVMINKGLGDRYPGVLVTALQTFVSIFLFIPFILPEVNQWRPISAVAGLHLMLLGVFCSACAYFFYLHAVKSLGAAKTSAFVNLIPVVSVTSGFFVLGERITAVQVVGTMLIIGSLFLMNRDQASKQTVQQKEQFITPSQETTPQ